MQLATRYVPKPPTLAAATCSNEVASTAFAILKATSLVLPQVKIVIASTGFTKLLRTTNAPAALTIRTPSPCGQIGTRYNTRLSIGGGCDSLTHCPFSIFRQ